MPGLSAIRGRNGNLCSSGGKNLDGEDAPALLAFANFQVFHHQNEFSEDKRLYSREPEWRELDPYAAQYGRLVKHHGAEPNQQIAGNREVGDDLVPRALCEGRMPPVAGCCAST
jgi:hypothetical protein